MEIIRLIALLLTVSLVLISCSSSPEELLSYQEKPFRAHITWQSESLSVSAILTSLPETNTKILKFTSPSSLSGIVLTKSGENISLSLDGLEISSPQFSRLADISRFFDIDGTLKKSFVETISGTKLNCVEVLNSNAESFTVYLYPNSGTPRRIVGELHKKPITLDVISFEFIPK